MDHQTCTQASDAAPSEEAGNGNVKSPKGKLGQRSKRMKLRMGIEREMEMRIAETEVGKTEEMETGRRWKR